MVSSFADRTPEDYARLRRDIEIFRNAYVDHLNRTRPMLQAGTPVPYDRQRSELQRLVVRAGVAVQEAGLQIVLQGPPAMPRPPLIGLTSVAFAHEDELWRNPPSPFGGHIKESPELVLDTLDHADALLQAREAEVRRRRRSPLYWGDRALRAVLGFPAYLISLVAGFDRRELSPDRARILWLVSVAADVASIFAFGRLLGWW